MSTPDPILADGLFAAVKHIVTVTKLHPILVNFTEGLIPVSIACDCAARFLKNESLRNTGWWTLAIATLVTPLTAITGWFFWMKDDNDVTGMAIHKWLGTGFTVLLFALFAYRLMLHIKGVWAPVAYLILGAILVGVLSYQGYLGGEQVFSGM